MSPSLLPFVAAALGGFIGGLIFMALFLLAADTFRATWLQRGMERRVRAAIAQARHDMRAQLDTCVSVACPFRDGMAR